jgi:hypothetical protein
MSDFVFSTKTGTDFEKPATGIYHGILADIVDLGMVTTIFQNVPKTQRMSRFIWVLDQNGKDGKPLSVTARYGVNLHEKSNLYKTVKQILGQVPLNLNPESLIGSVRKLLVQQEEVGVGDQKKVYANIIGISPAEQGKTMAVPSDFVRDKNKPADQQAKNKKPKGPQAQQAAPQTQAAVIQTPQGADVQF